MAKDNQIIVTIKQGKTATAYGIDLPEGTTLHVNESRFDPETMDRVVPVTSVVASSPAPSKKDAQVKDNKQTETEVNP